MDLNLTTQVTAQLATGEVTNLSVGMRHRLFNFAKNRIHPMHIFDFDKMHIVQHKVVKPIGTTKLYESTYDVLFMSGKKIRYSVCGIAVTREYKPHLPVE